MFFLSRKMAVTNISNMCCKKSVFYFSFLSIFSFSFWGPLFLVLLFIFFFFILQMLCLEYLNSNPYNLLEKKKKMKSCTHTQTHTQTIYIESTHKLWLKYNFWFFCGYIDFGWNEWNFHLSIYFHDLNINKKKKIYKYYTNSINLQLNISGLFE